MRAEGKPRAGRVVDAGIAGISPEKMDGTSGTREGDQLLQHPGSQSKNQSVSNSVSLSINSWTAYWV